ncbi:cysteine-rich KTR domain-containing protein [Pseudoramibacter alactolyticus]
MFIGLQGRFPLFCPKCKKGTLINLK